MPSPGPSGCASAAWPSGSASAGSPDSSASASTAADGLVEACARRPRRARCSSGASGALARRSPGRRPRRRRRPPCARRSPAGRRGRGSTRTSRRCGGSTPAGGRARWRSSSRRASSWPAMVLNSSPSSANSSSALGGHLASRSRRRPDAWPPSRKPPDLRLQRARHRDREGEGEHQEADEDDRGHAPAVGDVGRDGLGVVEDRDAHRLVAEAAGAERRGAELGVVDVQGPHARAAGRRRGRGPSRRSCARRAARQRRGR